MKTPTELQLDRERDRYRIDMREIASAYASLLIDHRRTVRARDSAEIEIEEVSRKNNELMVKVEQLRKAVRDVPAVWYGQDFVNAQAREIEGLKAEIDHLKFKINDLTNYTSYTPT